MKKKVIAVLLSGVMAAALAACGSSSSSSGSGSSTAPADSAATQAAESASTEAAAPAATEAAGSESASATGEDANTLTIWVYDDSNEDIVNKGCELYQKNHPDFKYNVIQLAGDDLELRFTTAGQSGDMSTLPDISMFQDGNFEKFANAYPGLFQDITDSGIPLDQFSEGKLAACTIDGKNYGVPFDNGIVIGAYRTDYLEQAGYTLDDMTDITWDDFEKIGKDVLDKTGHPMLSSCSTGPQLIKMMLGSMNKSFFADDGSANLTGDDVKLAAGEYVKLVQDGIIKETSDWDKYYEEFNSGDVAGVINGCWVMGNVKQADDQSGKWGLTNIPKFAGVDGATNYSKNGGSSFTITGNCTNKDLAIDFLKDVFSGDDAEEFYTFCLNYGMVATYLPAADYTSYATKDDFFGGQEVYKTLMDYAQYMPSVKDGVYVGDAMDDIAVATSNVILNGADLDSELQSANDTLSFAMDN